ncbi:UdgX family uracil-DNA binding protein [Kitasatospora herbaricolor]|uniref:UdgX family uracil-DNA binding protein n=1 Tax=Kitasatospora herbaricolor TaxID=68217 RepID=UPI0036DCD24F
MTDAEQPGAAEWVPHTLSLTRLRDAAHDCEGCELWRDATQVVFSAGTARARLMLVGEQPGDREDRTGEPFVGPAGRLLDEALDAAGIRRVDVYLTNAVKHFRHHTEERGKRRIHDKPAVAHIVACHPWLEAELAAVRPRVVVCLGATAGRAVFGRPVRVTAERGHVIADPGPDIPSAVITVHPSALLRTRGDAGWDESFDALVRDLVTAREAASL